MGFPERRIVGDNTGVGLTEKTLQEFNQSPGQEPCSVNQTESRARV